jgi:hypothetical protein
VSKVWFGFYQHLLGFTLHKTQDTRGLYTSGRHTYIHLYIGNKYSKCPLFLPFCVSIFQYITNAVKTQNMYIGSFFILSGTNKLYICQQCTCMYCNTLKTTKARIFAIILGILIKMTWSCTVFVYTNVYLFAKYFS